MTASEKTAIGTLVVSLIAAVGSWVSTYKISSVQREQTEIQQGQLAVARMVAASEEITAQNKQVTDLFPYISSKDKMQRALGIQMLQHVAPTALYSAILTTLMGDLDPRIRLAAIRQSERVRSKSAIVTLTAIASDATRTNLERDAAKESAISIQSNYDAIKACDLNGDGRVDINDVQIANNQVLKQARAHQIESVSATLSIFRT